MPTAYLRISYREHSKLPAATATDCSLGPRRLLVEISPSRSIEMNFLFQQPSRFFGFLIGEASTLFLLERIPYLYIDTNYPCRFCNQSIIQLDTEESHCSLIIPSGFIFYGVTHHRCCQFNLASYLNSCVLNLFQLRNFHSIEL